MASGGDSDSGAVALDVGVVHDVDNRDEDYDTATASGSVSRGSSHSHDHKREEAAHKAYQRIDKELNRLAENGRPETEDVHNTDQGQYVKSIVFGGLDGIITTFAVVASVAGANLATGTVIILGFSNLLADGVSMGFGEYLSGQAEQQYLEQERAREVWELENYPEGEHREMIELYQAKGFTREDAETVIGIISKQKDFFIDHMMVQELGLMPPDLEESPVKQGVVMFVAFLIFGLIPLLAYVVLATVDFDGWDPRFFIACCLTAVALFVLGAVRIRTKRTGW
eukprot:m.224981 g.224981  ORF g.224981 m.224981 type:complete len:283 (-) comp18780_c2_seq1:166-1014(-)